MCGNPRANAENHLPTSSDSRATVFDIHERPNVSPLWAVRGRALEHSGNLKPRRISFDGAASVAGHLH